MVVNEGCILQGFAYLSHMLNRHFLSLSVQPWHQETTGSVSS